MKPLTRLILAFLFINTNLLANWPSPMRLIGQAEGLSHDVVNDVLEDHQGYIWIATEEGLNRFDGHHFKTYYHHADHSKSLSHNQIFSLALHPDGKLWVGSDRGLDLFDPKTGLAEHINLPHLATTPLSSRSRTLLATPEGLWIGSGGGLYFLGKDWNSAPQAYRVPWGNDILALQRDELDNLWIATNEGLGTLSLKSGTFSKALDARTDGLTLHKQEIWAATTEGLLIIDPHNQVSRPATSLSANFAFLADTNVQTVFASMGDRLWYGGEGQVGWINPTQSNNRNLASLSQQWSFVTAQKFYLDSQENLWMATRRGLFLYNHSSEGFVNTTIGSETQTLSNPNVFALHESPDTFVYIGHGNGIDRLDPITGRVVAFPASLPGQSLITAINQLDMRNLIVGGENGLFLFNTVERQFEPFEVSGDPLPNHRVYAIHVGEDSILAGHFKGLWLIDRKKRTWKTLYPGDALGPERNLINSIKKVGANFLLGTRRGLIIYRPESNDFRFPAGALANMNARVFAIHDDKDGILWLGTDSGLIRVINLEQGTYTTLETKDGLPSASIYGILEDRSGNLWLSTNSGLARLNKDSLAIETFTVYDGLLSNEFNMGAFTTCRDSAMIFGGPAGIHRFYPSKMQKKQPAHKPRFSYLYLNNQNQDQLPSNLDQNPILELGPNINRLRLGFSSFTYTNPDTTYQYRIVNLDSDWQETSPGTSYAIYTNLPGGEHSLEVKLAGQDGPINQLRIKVAHRNTAMYLGIVAAVVVWTLLLWFLWGRRTKQSGNLRLTSDINQFLATTSHELRTPLNGIIGLSDTILSGDCGEINDRQSTNLKLIMSSARRLAHIVDSILDFSSMQEGGSHLTTTTVILPPLVEEALRVARASMEQQGKKLVLANEIPANFPELRADEKRVYQILNNLIDNAIKFTEKGYVRLRADVHNGHALIKVEDTGPGIPAKRHEDIFVAFQQMENATVRLHDGAGLGLSIVKQLVEEHNGRIWVDSKPGMGSTFNFTLPLLDPSINSLTDADILDTPTIVMAEMPSLLVVDDDAINRRVLSEGLSRDYSILEAADGQAALELIEQVHIDLVLLDVMMPGMSGFETCRAIRETRSQEELPIVFLTARNQQSDLERGYEAGGNDFLVKPFDRTELRMRLETHLNLIRARRRVLRGKKRQKALAAENQALAQERQRIEEEALTDPLTKLYNRRYAERYIQQEVLQVQPHFEAWLHGDGSKDDAMEGNLCFFLMDMDHFKSVNDTYGHDAGDKVLVDLAEILRTVARGKDQVIRWGGEEFLIISHLPDREAASGLATRFREAVANHVFVLPDEQRIQKTCSIGFACFPFVLYSPDAVSWQQVISLADGALYTAKLSGRNRWIGIKASGNTPVNDIPQNMVQNLANLVAEGIIEVEKEGDLPITFPE